MLPDIELSAGTDPAAYKGHLEISKHLYESFVRDDRPGIPEKDSLSWIAVYREGHIDIARYLLEQGYTRGINKQLTFFRSLLREDLKRYQAF